MGVLAGLSSDKPGIYLKSGKALGDMAASKSLDVVSSHVGMALGSFLRHCAKCVLA